MKFRNGIYTVIFIVLGVFFIVRGCQNRNMKDQLSSKEEALAEKTAELIDLKNKNGELVQQKRVAEIQANDLELYYKGIVNDLENNHNIKVRRLQSYIRGTLEASGSGTVEVQDSVVRVHDTVSVYKTFSIYDGFLDFEAFESFGSINYSYKYTDSLSFATFWKKSGSLFNRKLELTASIKSENPNSRFKNYESVSIATYKTKKFSLGVGGSVDIKGRVTPSLSLHYSLIRF